jgi:hypothetical protein
LVQDQEYLLSTFGPLDFRLRSLDEAVVFQKVKDRIAIIDIDATLKEDLHDWVSVFSPCRSVVFERLVLGRKSSHTEANCFKQVAQFISLFLRGSNSSSCLWALLGGRQNFTVRRPPRLE